ncbi:MAG: hypothetical protein HYY06_22105 [Deltaproteobacteria bacterium]|nr:hypothetical protein [Deltaproteobacteria bacterium]
MATEIRRSASNGAGSGLIAGVIFGVMEIVGAAIMGMPPLQPLRMFASVLLGGDALRETPLGLAALIGIVVHLVLSAAFGVIYALLNRPLAAKVRTSFSRESALGLLYGLVLWVVNVQVIARFAYSWFLETPQFLQAVMHAVFYGLPLAVMYVAGERRIHVLRPAPGST